MVVFEREVLIYNVANGKEVLKFFMPNFVERSVLDNYKKDTINSSSSK